MFLSSTGNESGVLTIATVVAVGHGLIHVRVGDDLTGLRMHVLVVPGRSSRFKEVLSLMLVVVGGRLVAEACDGDVGGVVEKAVVASGAPPSPARRFSTCGNHR